MAMRRAARRAHYRTKQRPSTGPAPKALVQMRPWTTLSQLVGEAMPLNDIVAKVRAFDRREGLFSLCTIAADLANAPGGPTGKEARAWSVDLLASRVGSENPIEDAIATAVSRLGQDAVIIHGHVLFVLQFLFATKGSDTGPRPAHAQLALLMLALNDHLHTQPGASTELPALEDAVASLAWCTMFNRTFDDPLRFVLRVTEMLGGDVAGGPIDQAQWEQIQQAAFGCSMSDYCERFLVPMAVFGQTWRNDNPPILDPAGWTKGASTSLYARWFGDASTTLDALEALGAERREDAPLWLPPEFLRSPFLALEKGLLCFSPWHLKDHALLGTWAKLNRASKEILGTDSNQAFMSTFGYLFERWCATLAREAAGGGRFKGRLLTPSSPGAADEIEDVVFVERDVVVLISAKSSLVPEKSLKSARTTVDVITWWRRFFLADKSDDYRAGLVWQLDKKVAKVRSGDFEERGISRHSIVIPVVVSFDNVGESGLLYHWLEEQCRGLGLLSSRARVRPLTLLAPEDFEALLALSSRGHSVCDLLLRKTSPAERWGPFDHFVHSLGVPMKNYRLPAMAARFEALTRRMVHQLRELGVLVP
jgi:hypothetical protein